MSETTPSPSTLTSPRSPLFSDSERLGAQSGTELITSDEEPDLGAFTTVLRAWGHLQPPLRIPTHLHHHHHPPSSTTRSTVTTLTGYPGLGSNSGSETIEESTVWNQRPIQSYLLSASRATGTASSAANRGERNTPEEDDVVLEESEDDEVPLYSSSSSPSSSRTASTEGSRTVEIASDSDTASLHNLSLSFENGSFGERLGIQVATPPSVDGRTVSVASARAGESHNGQSHPLHPPPRLSIQPSTSVHYGPHLPVVNDISASSDVSAPSMPTNTDSGQPFDDNTSTFRPRTYTPMLSLVSYRTNDQHPSVFQESPSPATTSNVVPFQEPLTATSPTSSMPRSRPPTLSRLSIDRLVSGLSSHLESDIVNSYFIQRPHGDSSSSDQPATDSPWNRPSRRLAILAPPPRSRPNSLHVHHHHQHQGQPPLREQGYFSPPLERETPSVVDDNSSSTSAAAILMERSPPPSASTTTSAVLSMLQEIVLNGNAGSNHKTESSGVESNHSLTPSHTHTLMFSRNSSATMDEIVRRSTVSSSSHRQPPPRHDTSFSSNLVDADVSSVFTEDLSPLRIREMMQRTTAHHTSSGSTATQYLQHHSLSQETDPEEGQPSLGYLDEALRFIAEERARLTATREGLLRGSSPSHRRDDQEQRQQHGQEREEIGVAALKHAIEPESRHKKHISKSNTAAATTPISSNIDSMSHDVNIITSTTASTSDHDHDHNENSNIIILNSPKKKKKKDKKQKVTTEKGRSKSTPRTSQLSDIKTISILKRPTDLARKHPEVEENLSPSSAAAATVVAEEGFKYDGSITPRAHHYLYPSWSSDNSNAIHDGDGDEEDQEGEWTRGLDLITTTITARNYHSYTRQSAASVTPDTHRFAIATPRASRSRVDLNLDSTNDEGASEENRDVKSGEGDVKGRKEKKKYKKKSKSVKRKVPVTTTISIPTAVQTPTTLSHSHSVPNLRSIITSRDILEAEEQEHFSSEVDDVLEQPVMDSSASIPSIRWKRRKKAKKPAEDSFILRGDPRRSASTSSMADGDGGGNSKRERLIALARYLQDVFPKERDQLQKVMMNLHSQTKMSGNASFPKKGREKVIKRDYLDGRDEDRLGESEEEDPDPRGEAVGKGSPPVHVFIDHSNILVGLLTYLKRNSRSKAKPKMKPKPSISYSTSNAVAHSAKHSLSIPKLQNGTPISAAKPLIPLPSFATARTPDTALSRSAPSISLLSHVMAKHNYTSSDGDDLEPSSYDEQEDRTPVFAFEHRDHGHQIVMDGPSRSTEDSAKRMRRVSRHLWHAALALILERGRTVTRRVAVASSPLYQPMESIKRLGYEVKVFMRVPDLREGRDRVEKSKTIITKEGGSPVNGLSNPIKSSGYGSWRGLKDKIHPSRKGHVRHISDSVTGGDAGLSVIAQQQQQLARVKYREQGVDELLQLKLLQAISDIDDVPEGATIILATGDGNVGQFNDDGFLGPVRTALRRGWSVELYAWEDGLSRSWQREFGPSSDWGRKGMFRIIAMEQFADSLIEIGERQSHSSA